MLEVGDRKSARKLKKFKDARIKIVLYLNYKIVISE